MRWTALVMCLALFPGLAPAVEDAYAFRSRLTTVHEPGRRDSALQPAADEFAFVDGVRVGDADFADYLSVSMGVKARAGRGGAVFAALDESLRDREYAIEVRKDGVEIRAADARSLHQAYYHLEDLMNLRRAPFLKIGRETRRALFSPRMVHSGWGLDVFPDGHLRQMAHAGIDAILAFLEDVDTTQGGGKDAKVNDTIERALKAGLDTYFYSKVQGFAHPADPDGARKLQDSFGRVAAAHPKASHAPGLGGLRITTDFPGFYRRYIESETGAKAMFVQGAAGDLVPKGDELGVAAARKVGENLAMASLAAVIDILRNAARHPEARRDGA